MARQFTFANLEKALAKAGPPTNTDLKLALQDIYNAMTGRGGDVITIIVLDISTTPTDATVSAITGEVFDGQTVGIRSGANLKLYQRVAGQWLYYVAGP